MSFSYYCVEECTVLVSLFAFANLRIILTRKCSMATGHDHVKSTPQRVVISSRWPLGFIKQQLDCTSELLHVGKPPHPMSTFFVLNTLLCSLEETSSDVLLLGPLLDSWYATSRPAFSMIESGSRKDRRCSAQLLHFLESWQANWGWGPWPLVHRSLQQLLESFRPCKGEVSAGASLTNVRQKEATTFSDFSGTSEIHQMKDVAPARNACVWCHCHDRPQLQRLHVLAMLQIFEIKRVSSTSTAPDGMAPGFKSFCRNARTWKVRSLWQAKVEGDGVQLQTNDL